MDRVEREFDSGERSRFDLPSPDTRLGREFLSGLLCEEELMQL